MYAIIMRLGLIQVELLISVLISVQTTHLQFIVIKLYTHMCRSVLDLFEHYCAT